MVNVFIEAMVVGIICMFVGVIVFEAVALLYPSRRLEQSVEHRKKNKIIQLLMSLFLTGFLGHLFFEFTGINKQLYRWTGVWLW